MTAEAPPREAEPTAEPQPQAETAKPQRRMPVPRRALATARAGLRPLVRSTRSQVRRTPLTRLGWTVLVGGLLLWLAGWILGWLELATMAALCLVLLVLSIPFTLGRTAVTSRLELNSARVVVGEPAAAELVVRSVGQRRQLPFDLALPVGETTALFAIPSLAADAEHQELLIIPTERRGVIEVGPASAVRGDPIGLLRRAVPAGERQVLYVHPRTVRLGNLGHGLIKDLEGSESNVLSNSDIAFHALREYVPGDDQRHIHWKATARASQLMVRQFIDTRRSHMTIVLSGDPRDYASDDEFETAVSVAASIGVQALRDQQRLRVVYAGKQLPTAAPQRLLDALSAVDVVVSGGSIAANQQVMSTDTVADSLKVLVAGSLLAPQRMRADARRLSATGDVLCVRATPEQESGFSFIGGVPTLSVGDIGDLRRLLKAAS